MKKKKKSNPKKGIVIFVIIIAVLIVLAVIMTEKKDMSTPEATIMSYMNCINEKDYVSMYRMLSAKSRASITEEEFVTRYKNIYEGIDASDVKVSVTNIEKQANEKEKVSYDITMRNFGRRSKLF